MTESVDEFVARASRWLEQRCDRTKVRPSLQVSVFHDLEPAEELAVVRESVAWHRVKIEAGFGAIAWPAEVGGAGLGRPHESAFNRLEGEFATPRDHEIRRITVNLVAPTIDAFGTQDQRARFVEPFLRCDELVCQLFSEPGAGSDLAALQTRARDVGDGTWTIDGSKVWVSGALHAQYGFLLARTDADSAHAGITAFLLPMGSDGVTVRPIRQMTGGRSFNEVFFDGVAIPDELRIGDVGSGWQVARTMLGFERGQSGSRTGVGGSCDQLLALVRLSGREIDPAVRDLVVRAFLHETLRGITRQRSVNDSGRPGPAGSLGKLLWVDGMILLGECAMGVGGLNIVADLDAATGEFAWSEHVVGAPGYRIAGGSDEIQRSIIAERVLGLPRDLR